MLEGFDIGQFWSRSRSLLDDLFVDDPLTEEKITSTEIDLGYRLPRAYIAIARVQNGGVPRKVRHPTRTGNGWSPDVITIEGIFAIGSRTDYSLCGRFGSRFYIDDWGYPPLGVYFAECPSEAHEMLCLDYQAVGPDGEPRVVHVDQERDYRITPVAPDFETFLRALELETAEQGPNADRNFPSR